MGPSNSQSVRRGRRRGRRLFPGGGTTAVTGVTLLPTHRGNRVAGTPPKAMPATPSHRNSYDAGGTRRQRRATHDLSLAAALRHSQWTSSRASASSWPLQSNMDITLAGGTRVSYGSRSTLGRADSAALLQGKHHFSWADWRLPGGASSMAALISCDLGQIHSFGMRAALGRVQRGAA